MSNRPNNSTDHRTGTSPRPTGLGRPARLPSPTPRHRHYDVVVVGARAAGASTAMLMARSGLKVLAVDRQAYGSDTLSTHALMRGAVSRLANWNLLDSVIDRGTPVITSTSFSYGDESIDLQVKPEPGMPGLVAPRRTVLDSLLVDAARSAGAEVLHQTKVQALQTDNDGRVTGVELHLADGTPCAISSDLVIGADGLRSYVARAVDAPITHTGRYSSAFTMRYYTDLDVDRSAFRWMYQPEVGGGVIPTGDGATCVFTGIRPERFAAEGRKDVGRTHDDNIRTLDPALAEAVAVATPLARTRSWPGVPGQFRKPHGPGWALVGDAGYFKDPYAAHGITDAFRDAELITEAVLSGDFAHYETLRNELSMPLFAVLDQIASYDWDLEALKGLHYQLSKAMKTEDRAILSPLTLAA